MTKSKTLATIDLENYVPVFDENNDTYIDKCPYNAQIGLLSNSC